LNHLDKHIKGIAKRLADFTGNGSSIDDTIDDYYYIVIRSRRDFIVTGTFESRNALMIIKRDHLHVSLIPLLDELDFILKRELRPSPEQRYADEKKNFLFHSLSCYMRGLGESGYGCTGKGCVLECEYFGDFGRIEDSVIIEKHNKFVESFRQKNAIVDPPTTEEMRQAEKELPSYLFT
jgi:hypothetical protein